MPELAAFVLGTAVSLGTSWLLVSRLERIGERLGLSEALLGMVAALAADAPEISAAASALASHQRTVGAGVVLGSNVFNIAALLGLGALTAGQIRLHRRVVALGGAIALWVALVATLVTTGILPVAGGLLLALVVLAAFLVLLGTEGQRLSWLPLPHGWWAWLRSAVTEEETELSDAIRPAPARRADVAVAAIALVVVVLASITMEHAAVGLGSHHEIPQIITGALILAAVTSLPNAVAAVYLAARGRGAATLSTALNSNTINVVVGLLLPGALLGLGPVSGPSALVAFWYAGLTLAVLIVAYRCRGISRGAGGMIIVAYAVFTVCLLATAHV